MPIKQNRSVRLNIYVHDPRIRRQIKAVAAQKDISVSEYCLRAITHQLIKEKKIAREEIGRKEISPLKTAVERARNFQTKTFGGKVFSVSSAELIRESRENRNGL